MALDAGANSPSLAVNQGEPSASDLEMYACTSRTCVMHSIAEVSFFYRHCTRWRELHSTIAAQPCQPSHRCIRTNREASDTVAGGHVNAHDMSCLGCQ
jgi:hypothetical protein